MNNRDELVCDDPLNERCEDCPRPAGCIWECAMNSYVQEDVAKIRDEERQ